MRSEEDMDDRPVVGECELCGHELHAESDGYDADDFVEVENFLLCHDCWEDYYKELRRNWRWKREL